MAVTDEATLAANELSDGSVHPRVCDRGTGDCAEVVRTVVAPVAASCEVTVDRTVSSPRLSLVVLHEE